MSTYRVENRSLNEEEYFDDYCDVVDYRNANINCNLIFYELCKGNETEFYIVL